VTGEVATVCATRAEAREITDRFRAAAQNLADALDELREVVPAAYASGAWRVLGYQSWDAYCRAEVGARLVRIGRDQRRELVSALAAAGMSSRAIGSALAISYDTAQRDARGDRYLSPTDPIPADDRATADLVVDAIVARYDAADTDEDRRRWALPLMLADEILSWGRSDTPALIWFGKVAQQMYCGGADIEVWELMAPWLRAVAEASLAECAEMRRKRGADGSWRLPGERLAEITTALCASGISPDVRLAMFTAMETQIVVAVAECSLWWPIPSGDVRVARAAEVLAHVTARRNEGAS
jgi:hypothetical protein